MACSGVPASMQREEFYVRAGKAFLTKLSARFILPEEMQGRADFASGRRDGNVGRGC